MLRKKRRVLVSVRSAREAEIAIGCGVDFLDLKEPSRGALGACDVSEMQAVAGLVTGNTVLTVALGELLECQNGEFAGQLPADVSLLKFGLAGCAHRGDWRELWRCVTGTLAEESKAVLVGYADCEAAESPALPEVMEYGIVAGVRYVLIDTYRKAGRGLWEHVELGDVERWQKLLMKQGIQLAIAGSLRLEDLVRLKDFPGELIVGMRSGVCEEREREGVLSRTGVERLVQWAHDRNQSEVTSFWF